MICKPFMALSLSSHYRQQKERPTSLSDLWLWLLLSWLQRSDHVNGKCRRTVQQLLIYRKAKSHLFILCYPLKRRFSIQSVLMDNVTKIHCCLTQNISHSMLHVVHLIFDCKWITCFKLKACNGFAWQPLAFSWHEIMSVLPLFNMLAIFH